MMTAAEAFVRIEGQVRSDYEGTSAYPDLVGALDVLRKAIESGETTTEWAAMWPNGNIAPYAATPLDRKPYLSRALRNQGAVLASCEVRTVRSPWVVAQ